MGKEEECHSWTSTAMIGVVVYSTTFFQCLLLQRKAHRNNGVAVSKLRGWKLRMSGGGSREMISLWCKFDTKSGRK